MINSSNNMAMSPLSVENLQEESATIAQGLNLGLDPVLCANLNSWVNI
jgi:hypothetical protein